MALSTLLVLCVTTLALSVSSENESSSLSLRDMRITAITEKHFSSYSHVTELDLSDNSISFIHPQGFCGMNYLFKLDLSDNRINYINPATFKCTPMLRRLNLKNNHNLGIGVNHIFLHSSSITLLDISYCNFKLFSNQMFSAMTSLKVVIAFANPVCQNFKGQLDNFRVECGVPRRLELSSSNVNNDANNALVSVEQVTRTPVQQQSSSDLNVRNNNDNNRTSTHNHVSKPAETGEFSTGTEYRLISISSERITTEESETKHQVSDHGEVSSQNHQGMKINSDPSAVNEQRSPESFTTIVQHAKDERRSKNPEKMKSNAPSDIDLENYRNEIKKMREIPEYYFIGMDNVLNLDLSGLNIIHIHHMGLCGLHSLRKLTLSANDLRYLHPDTFLCTPNLQVLILSHNSQLELYSPNVFLNSKSLKYLDVSFCNFAILPKAMLSQMPSLIFVNAFGNSGCPQIVNQFKGIRNVPCLEEKHNEDSKRDDILKISNSGDQIDGGNVIVIVITVLIILSFGVGVVAFVIWKYKTGTRKGKHQQQSFASNPESMAFINIETQ